MQDLTIRPIERTDKDDWLRLWAGYNAFYERVGPTALPAEITEATWERFFDVDEPVYALVAVDKRAVLGIAHFILHRSTTLLGPNVYMQDLFTDPAARGRGVGRALIQAVYARAREAGSRSVYWLTHEANHTARRLYDQVAEHSGFIVYRKRF